MIAQLSNASEAQKLYVNQSMDPHTPVTVEVERDGLHQVTIFPIREGRGILDSNAEHLLVLVTYYPTTTTTTTTTTATTATTTTTTTTIVETAYTFPQGK